MIGCQIKVAFTYPLKINENKTVNHRAVIKFDAFDENELRLQFECLKKKYPDAEFITNIQE